MNIKERIRKIGESTKNIWKQHKTIVISCIVVMGVSAGITMNISLIQMSIYTFNKETSSVIELLEKRMLSTNGQNRLHIDMGIEYLIEVMDEASQKFINQYFDWFEDETQLQVIEVYNDKDLLLDSNREVIDRVIKGNATNEEKKYINRISLEDFEKELDLIFGENPELNEEVITKLYDILKLRSDKLVMQNFEFSLYDLMQLPHEGNIEHMAIQLIGQVAPEVVREKLFDEMKGESIELYELYIWVEVLHKKNILTTEQYAKFTNAHSEVKRVNEEMSNLAIEEIELNNTKEGIDLQTTEAFNQIEKVQEEIILLKDKIVRAEVDLSQKSTYKTIDVYILDQYSSGEYEAANPEKSWLFNSYKPGNQRMIVKVSDTAIDRLGVYTLEVYDRGADDEGVRYYEEVSSVAKEEIRAIQEGLQENQELLDEKLLLVDTLTTQIDTIRSENNYKQVVESIEGLSTKEEKLEIELKTQQLQLQTLFGIGTINMLLVAPEME